MRRRKAVSQKKYKKTTLQEETAQGHTVPYTKQQCCSSQSEQIFRQQWSPTRAA